MRPARPIHLSGTFRSTYLLAQHEKMGWFSVVLVPCLSYVLQQQVAAKFVDDSTQDILCVVPSGELAFNKVRSYKPVAEDATPDVDAPTNLMFMFSEPIRVLV